MLSNKELQADPQDPEYAREIRRRKKRNRTRPVKPPVQKRQKQSLLDDPKTGIIPSGKRNLL